MIDHKSINPSFVNNDSLILFGYIFKSEISIFSFGNFKMKNYIYFPFETKIPKELVKLENS